ncbi:MAG: hypothetical protein IPM35_33480 [Myxococcales bacterium]|nr:hypothetical protein [Myxococcales bacterium]
MGRHGARRSDESLRDGNLQLVARSRALAFRDAGSGWLTLAEHFPNPTLGELTGVAVSAFAFRP